MKNNKPFYKIWWFWLIVVVLVVIIFGMIGSGGSSSDDDTSNKASGHTTTQTEKGTKSSSNKDTLDINYDNHKILDQKSYDVSFNDNSWQPANIKVSKVSIFKLNPYTSDDDSNTKSEGYIIIHMSVAANRDITTYPDQGTLVTNDGQQVDAVLDTVKGYKENWAGEISKGVTKQGDILFPIEKLSKISDMKTLRLKFDAYYDTDNYEDENAQHDYDITLNLNQ